MAAWLESAWLARYLDRQLEGEELAWFEAYLLDKPELVGAVEVDNELWDSLQSPSTGKPLEWKGGTEKPALGRIFGYAAAIAFAAGAGWFGRALSLDGSPALIPSPTRIVLDTMRGPEQQPRIYAPPSAYALIEVAVPDEARDISVVLGRREMPLVRARDGFASFVVRGALLERNTTLQVQYVQNGKLQTQEFPISLE
jgi:hypothetical protein